jgi:hypothetical protein
MLNQILLPNQDEEFLVHHVTLRVALMDILVIIIVMEQNPS